MGESRRIRVPTATRWARGPAPFVYLKCAEEKELRSLADVLPGDDRLQLTFLDHLRRRSQCQRSVAELKEALGVGLRLTRIGVSDTVVD